MQANSVVGKPSLIITSPYTLLPEKLMAVFTFQTRLFRVTRVQPQGRAFLPEKVCSFTRMGT